MKKIEKNLQHLLHIIQRYLFLLFPIVIIMFMMMMNHPRMAFQNTVMAFSSPTRRKLLVTCNIRDEGKGRQTKKTSSLPHCKISLFSTADTSNTSINIRDKLVTIPEAKWRLEASQHSQRIHSILEPGLTSIHDKINSGLHKKKKNKTMKNQQNDSHNDSNDNANIIQWTALDTKNPIFNFLIEYYGLKGAKGPRRLARWSPSPTLLLQIQEDNEVYDDSENDRKLYSKIMSITNGHGGIFLENANEQDLNGLLNLRGAIPITSNEAHSANNDQHEQQHTQSDGITVHGMLYNPSLFYEKFEPVTSTNQKQKLIKTIAPFQWYKSILETTIASEPIFHCHGLHEWAMLYHPPGAPPPPSAKFQNELPIRVSQEIINTAVERRGISCTHVDALRFFAPAAGPLNYHGATLQRTEQLVLEQKGCVHAHMDLLKIALKLQPFLDSTLLCDVLEVSIMARKLDVEASPYDVRGYGGGVVAVETEEGRRIYRSRQMTLMDQAEPVRERLLHAYAAFMSLAFDEALLEMHTKMTSEKKHEEEDRKSLDVRNGEKERHELEYADPERYAQAEPGGLPWRKNLIKTE